MTIITYLVLQLIQEILKLTSQGAYQAHSREDPKSLVYVRTSSTDDANNNSDKD
jgi:hypothetical protein